MLPPLFGGDDTMSVRGGSPVPAPVTPEFVPLPGAYGRTLGGGRPPLGQRTIDSRLGGVGGPRTRGDDTERYLKESELQLAQLLEVLEKEHTASRREVVCFCSHTQRHTTRKAEGPSFSLDDTDDDCWSPIVQTIGYNARQAAGDTGHTHHEGQDHRDEGGDRAPTDPETLFARAGMSVVGVFLLLVVWFRVERANKQVCLDMSATLELMSVINNRRLRPKKDFVQLILMAALLFYLLRKVRVDCTLASMFFAMSMVSLVEAP